MISQRDEISFGNKHWFGPYQIQCHLFNNTTLFITLYMFDLNPIVVNVNKLKLNRFVEQVVA
jgi:hypothetical protein